MTAFLKRILMQATFCIAAVALVTRVDEDSITLRLDCFVWLFAVIWCSPFRSFDMSKEDK